MLIKSAETCKPKLTFTESKPLNQLQGENGAFDFVWEGSLRLNNYGENFCENFFQQTREIDQ